MDDPDFRFLIKPGIDLLRENGHTLTINRPVILGELMATSKIIRDHIGEELKGRLFSIMFDVTTKSTLSVLGVNASFIENDEVICRSLGVVKINERHTGENIAMLVREIFAALDVSIQQIYAVTTDNGTNMIKTTRMLNEMLNEYDDQAENGDEHEDELSENGEDESDGLDSIFPPASEDVLSERFSAIIEDMTQNITLRQDYVAVINAVRCCAHTLQLAIHTSLSQSNAMNILAHVRAMCKQLRTQAVNVEFRKLSPNTILPPLDNITRWCSEFVMVSIMLFRYSL